MRRLYCSILVLGGCGPSVELPPGADEGTTTGTVATTSMTTSGAMTTTSAMTTTTTTTSGDASSGAESSSEGGGAFLPDPDFVSSVECSIWEEDCPLGEKCMPWANDGGNSWNATKCVPIADDPGAVGDPCTVEENGVSGIDDCELHAMCWDVDPATLMGTCFAFCTGSEADPMCDEPQTRCSISGEGVLTLCLPLCDPLAQDCPDGEACVGIADYFICLQPGTVQNGEPCEYIDECVAGHACVPGDYVPGCEELGCCSAFCALDDPQCGDGQSCIEWFGPGGAPKGYENVGVCGIPE